MSDASQAAVPHPQPSLGLIPQHLIDKYLHDKMRSNSGLRHYFNAMTGDYIEEDFNRDYVSTGKWKRYKEAIMQSGRHRERKEKEHESNRGVVEAERYEETLGALGVEVPDLKFGLTRHIPDQTFASVTLSFLGRPFNVTMPEVWNEGTGNRTNTYYGTAVCCSYTKAAGFMTYCGSYNSSSGTLFDPYTASDPVPDSSVMGLYELFLANQYLDPLFRYINLEDVELQFRLVPPPRSSGLVISPAGIPGYSSVADLGTVRLFPWYGEPGPASTVSGANTVAYLDENYINQIKPQRIYTFPTMDKTSADNIDALDWHKCAFIPVRPSIVDQAGTATAVEYARVQPTDMISWLSGASTFSANLFRYVWYFPHATIQRDAAGDLITTQYNCRIEFRFKVTVKWWNLMPPQLFSIDTPRPTNAAVLEWAKKVQAANEAAVAQEIKDAADVMATLPKAPKTDVELVAARMAAAADPSAALDTDFERLDHHDADEMED